MEPWQNYLSKLDPNRRNLVLKVLTIAQKFAPGSVAAMPYGVPGLKINGKNLIAAAVHKNHLGIYPFSPDIVKTISSQLPSPNIDRGTLRFGFDDFPSETIIKQIVQLRLAEIG